MATRHYCDLDNREIPADEIGFTLNIGTYNINRLSAYDAEREAADGYIPEGERYRVPIAKSVELICSPCAIKIRQKIDAIIAGMDKSDIP